MKKTIMARILTALLAALLLVTAVAPITASAAANINVAPVITAYGLTKPTKITQGNAFSMQGSVSTNAGTITKITATVTERSTNWVVLSATVQPKLKAVNFRNTINQKVPFGKLGVGNYTLKVVVTAKCGTKSTTKTVINQGFSVVAKQPTITLAGAVYPTTMKVGNKQPIRGVISVDACSGSKITKVVATVKNSKGKVMMQSVFKPNKTVFDLHYTVNNELTFGLLPVGTYTYTLTATATCGKSTFTKTLLNKTFKVTK
ncbi:MAG: hypothetical protein Q4G19_02600 [Clostridia bacterium]|nr:hypothetical protein [Clostridia bacterium]